MDTYTRSDLALPTHTHSTQGIIPFSAVQSLKLCIPFHCYSGCAVRNNQPSISLSEAPHALGLSSSLPLPLLNGYRPQKQMHTQKLPNLWVEENSSTTKWIAKEHKKNP